MEGLIELTEDMTDEEIRAGLAQRADIAIECLSRVGQLAEEGHKAQKALRDALGEVGAWMELLSESFNSLTRRGYRMGWEEQEDESWKMIIRPLTPPDHINLDE